MELPVPCRDPIIDILKCLSSSFCKESGKAQYVIRQSMTFLSLSNHFSLPSELFRRKLSGVFSYSTYELVSRAFIVMTTFLF